MEPKALPLRQKYTVAVRNVRHTPVRFILEPQGAEFAMPPGAVFELRAEGPEGDRVEIDFGPDQIVAWGWPGSVVEVWHDGVSLSGRSIPVPAVPAGMSVRGFLGMVLGDPELQEPGSTIMSASSAPDIERGLLAFYHTGAPDRGTARLLELSRISEGWENEVYSFALADAAATSPAREDLVLRIYPGSDAARKSAREFEAMRRLREAGYPVPQVLWLESDPSWLGRPFVIMEKISGGSADQVFAAASPERQQELLTLFCQLLVDLHALEWRSVLSVEPALGDEMPAIMERELSRAQASCASLAPREFDPVLDWLRERFSRVRWGQPCLVHRDYHGENLLIRDDGAAFVIDWGNIRVSDRRSDLGWTLLLSSTYGHPEMRARILQEYERIAGGRMEDMDYFDVAAVLRRLVSIVGSLDQGAEQLGMRPGAEGLMRDAPHIQAVYDVLLERTGLRIPRIEALLASLG